MLGVLMTTLTTFQKDAAPTPSVPSPLVCSIDKWLLFCSIFFPPVFLCSLLQAQKFAEIDSRLREQNKKVPPPLPPSLSLLFTHHLPSFLSRLSQFCSALGTSPSHFFPSTISLAQERQEAFVAKKELIETRISKLKELEELEAKREELEKVRHGAMLTGRLD